LHTLISEGDYADTIDQSFAETQKKSDRVQSRSGKSHGCFQEVCEATNISWFDEDAETFKTVATIFIGSALQHDRPVDFKWP